MSRRVLVQVFRAEGQVLDSSEDLFDDHHVSRSCAPPHHALQLPQNAALAELALRAAVQADMLTRILDFPCLA